MNRFTPFIVAGALAIAAVMSATSAKAALVYNVRTPEGSPTAMACKVYATGKLIGFTAALTGHGPNEALAIVNDGFSGQGLWKIDLATVGAKSGYMEAYYMDKKTQRGILRDLRADDSAPGLLGASFFKKCMEDNG